MAILIRTSVMRHCALALLLVALTAAVCIAQTNPELAQHPYVDCPATQTNCHMCRLFGELIVCGNCTDGYSTNIPSGKCEPYSGECTAVGCRRCASNNPALCAFCLPGYTYQFSNYSCTPNPTTTTAPTTTAAPCLAPHCAVCSSGSLTKCATCNTGYTLMNYGACKPTGSCAVANCAQCRSDNDGFCATCRSGYRSTVAGGCRRGNGAAYTHPTALVAIVMALVAYAATML